MPLHPDVQARLHRLTPDQRAAATAEHGPVLCLAPAGSGKTTTLVARIAWLVATGTPADRIAAMAFNKRAADELQERVTAALEPLAIAPGTVRVRTFHAFGREILRAAGRSVEPLVERDEVLRRVVPDADAAERRQLDTAFSALKLEHRVDVEVIAADPQAGPRARAFVAYERAIAASGGLDFDDLVARPLTLLEAEPELLAGWRSACAELLVDEVQDVDRSQLGLALLIAAPANRIFLVGDDDQSIYGWRLADVRRVLDLAGRLPGLRRHDLETNFRCPAPVVERAVRLVEGNAERFAKRIVARPNAVGQLILAPDAADDDERARHILATWPTVTEPGGEPRPSQSAATGVNERTTHAILARTNRELLPAAAIALELGIPFRAERLALPLEDPRLDGLLAAIEAPGGDQPLLVRLASLRRGALPAESGDERSAASEATLSFDELLAAVLAWAAPYRNASKFIDAVRARRLDLADLRRDDAALTLATAHSTKGLEFDHVAVVDMDAGRFPSQRTLDDADDPDRALEEERRLAYVAWTRARRSLTLIYDPAAPSCFLLEAFDPVELGLGPTSPTLGR
jgi:DNA helicase II / ATP-dependent DNA helicase PcrA